MALLERRRNKNDTIWSISKSILKLPPFFTARIGERKTAENSKLNCLWTKWSRSYIALALVQWMFGFNVLQILKFHSIYKTISFKNIACDFGKSEIWSKLPKIANQFLKSLCFSGQHCIIIYDFFVATQPPTCFSNLSRFALTTKCQNIGASTKNFCEEMSNFDILDSNQ